MKTTIITLTMFTFIAACSVTGCSSSEQKVENAESDVIRSSQELDDANEEYLTELENYRIETAILLAKNEQSIVNLKSDIAKQKDESIKNDGKIAIDELEQKNIDMKKKLDNYDGEGKSNWEKFKSEFSHDMEELGKAFKKLTTNDVK